MNPFSSGTRLRSAHHPLLTIFFNLFVIPANYLHTKLEMEVLSISIDRLRCVLIHLINFNIHLYVYVCIYVYVIVCI